MQSTLELIKESQEIRQAHLRLNDACVERGGNSTNHKGVLAQFLDTDIPSGFKIQLCHACHNEKCSNPRHLYWGSPGENARDAISNGTRKNLWENTVAKYGLEEARKMQGSKVDFSRLGKMGRGKPKSEEHKKKISESLKKRNASLA